MALTNLQFIIGDGIVIWRAIALWPHSYWIQGGLCLLFLGDVGMYLEVTIGNLLTHFRGWLA